MMRQPSHLVGNGVRIPEITPQMHERISKIARDVNSQEPRISDISAFGERVRSGFGDGAAVLIGDTGEIPLMIDTGRHHLDYRLGWLARNGDLVLIGGPASPAFEAYQKRVLDQPDIDYLHVKTGEDRLRKPVPYICLHDVDVYQELLAWVSEKGGATLMPHITTGTIWALATRLSEDGGFPVHVAGPPPLLSRRVNNKIWFGSLVTRLLGKNTVPKKRKAQSTSALTRHVMDLAQEWDRLVVKVPDSADSAGNVVLDGKAMRGMKPVELYYELRHRLAGLGWPPPFPVAVEVWDFNVLNSPSIQTWIPQVGTPPIIEGIYEQVLAGDEKAFVGAVEAELPDDLNQELLTSAMQLAILLQTLGYYGRCSFDTIVFGQSMKQAQLHWIECNGRWGGVSVPMSLINRLSGQATRPVHVIVQDSGLTFRPRSFSGIEEEFDDQFPSSDLTSGVVFLSPNLIEDGAGCHNLAFRPSRKAAISRSKAITDRLLAQKTLV